ncbi:hypothetical protein [Limosilactobacillus caecicola]|uniref:hypothetical protein n=1 Tax=Limosilactobacillus caecicola TaxID=2941332 RepID=UPI00203B7158|nr:hypothetical protein [Limosilactobacillus caecicola]
MKRKNVVILSVAGLALVLAGCGAQSSPTNNASSSSLLASKSSTKISADNLTPQQTVSLVTTYAGNKYGQQWAQTAKQAKKAGLQVDLYPASNYKLADNGQGVAYNVKANGQSSKLVYTVNGDNVTIYQNASKTTTGKKLTTVSRADMVSYINQNGQGDHVNQLAQNAQVNDKRSGDSTTTGSSSTGTSGKYGNEGAVTVPSEMRGTWYCAKDGNSTVTFGKHTYNFTSDKDNEGSNGPIHLYKQSKSFLEDEDSQTNQTIVDATKNWGRTTFTDLDGFHWLNIQGWCQGAGDGSFYAIHTENIDGKQVKILVAAGGAEIQAYAVYYQTQDQAQQYANKKFDDIRYYEDD